MINNNANNSVVAIYKSHAEAEAAVKELQHSDFVNRTNPEALEEHQPARASTEACVVGA